MTLADFSPEIRERVAAVKARDGHARPVQRLDPIRSTPSRLTGRQLQVLQLIAAGDTNNEIAGELQLSSETIKTYVRQLLQRLDARNRAHLVARGFEAGHLHAG